MSWLFADLRYKLFAGAIAIFLWGVAHGSATVDRGFDVPVVFQGAPENLVLIERSVGSVNVRVEGRRAALRNLTPEDLEYRVDVSGVKPGGAEFEVDIHSLDLPRGLRPVAHSPSRILASFERKGRKTVRVRADLEGEPAVGFALAGVDVDPVSVRIAGASSQVKGLEEVVTEPIDLSGAEDTVEREVRLRVGARNVWVDQDDPVTVRVRIEPTIEPDETEIEGGDDPA